MKNNRRFFVVLIVMVLLLPLSACASKQTDSQRLHSAYENYQKGKYRAAFIELKNLLQANPRNKDARLLLGRTAMQMGDFDAAEIELERARELGATADEYYVLELKNKLLLGQYQQILDTFDISNLQIADNRFIAQVFYGNALNTSGASDNAESAYRKVIAETSSTEPLRRAYLGLAEISRSKGDMKSAKEQTEKALEYDTNAAESLIALGQLLLEEKNYSGAQEQFVKARGIANSSANERFVVAAGEVETALGLADLEESKHAADRLYALAPQHPVSGFLMARVAVVRGDKEVAYEHLQQVLAKYPRFKRAQLLQGALSLQRNEFEQAEALLSSVVTAQPGNTEARKLLAETYLQMGEPEKAASILREAVDAGVTDQGMITLLGRASMNLGETDASISYLKQALATNPQDPNLKLTLASAYVAAGQASKAVELFESDTDSTDDKRKSILFLLAAVQSKDTDKARQQAELIASKWPGDSQASNLVGGWYYSQGDYDKARTMFDAVLTTTPDDINALTNLGRIDLLQKNYAQARQRYEAFLKRNPGNETGLLSMAYVLQSEGKSTEAIKFVQQAHQLDPSAEAPATILARIHLLNKNIEKAAEYAEGAVAANPMSVSANVTMGLVEMEGGKFENALNLFAKADQLRPGSTHILRNKGKAELALNRETQARATFEQIWKLDPADLMSARALVLLEQKAGRLDQSKAILDKLKKDQPNNAKVLEIEGDFQREGKNSTAAINAYRKAYEQKPDRDLALKLFAMAELTGSDPAPYLREWLKESPDDDRVRILLAQHLQKLQLNSQAIKEYETLLVSQPKSVLVLNNLAWLYFEQNNPETQNKALELAAQAYQGASTSPQIIDTYGWLLFRSGKLEKGKELLVEANKLAQQNQSSASADISYHLAAVLKESGDHNGARSLLQELLKDGKNFQSRSDAQQLLDSL